MSELADASASETLYPNRSYGQTRLAEVMRATYDELIDVVTTDEFTAAMAEMGALDAEDRPEFVLSVFLDPEALVARNITVPDGVLIQRSAFGDRRPTLFCVKKFLPEEFSDVWQNVNLTFDNEFLDGSVSRAADLAWREPLPVHSQAQAMREGIDLQELP